MAKLILEEGGKRRRFRLNEGRMTIGSGDAATLTLTGDGVAEVHAELVFKDGEAVLVPRPGVAPLKVGGRAVTGELALADGVPVLIGAAKLSVDYERAAAAPAKSPRARSVRERDAEGGQERVQRTRSRATRSAGLPGWLTAVVILAIVAVAFFLVKNSLDSGSDTGSIDELTSKNRIEDSLLNGEFKGALLELDRVERKPDLAPEWRRAFQVLRQKAEAASGSGAEAARNAQGTPYLETQLKKFVSGRLLKDPSSRPKARVFMKRARWWIEQFPTHPERDWVDRHVARYGRNVISMALEPL